MRFPRLLLLAVGISALCAARPLLVISVDGLDQRYLRDADRLGMRIPNMRKLMREGAWANGVIGVVPTVTWPSHTSLITGVTPQQHGILNNRRPQPEGGDYYWTADLLHVPTLLNALRTAGRKSGAITWPVTVDAPVDFNLPEYFRRRNGGAMDLESIETKSTPGLVEEIGKQYPSFPKQWMDDRGRAQAVMFILRSKHPDLLLVHFVDHDAEAHETGPFSRESKAILEYTDELIGDILKIIPADYALALVSDHGFERTDKVVSLKREVGEDAVITPYLLTAKNTQAAAHIRELARKSDSCIGREIPLEELRKRAPALASAAAAWEPAERCAFSAADPAPPAKERGNHGFWPTRADYRSVFLLWGPGVKSERLPEIEMTSIAGRLATVLGVQWPPAR